MVFTQILRRLVYIALCGILSSCTAYRTLQIEMLEPSQIQLNEGKHIALLDRNICYQMNPIRFIERYEEVSRENLYAQFTLGLADLFADTERFDSIVPLAAQEVTVLENQTLPKPLSPDSVTSLCQKYKVDYLISIELFYYDIPQTTGVLSNHWLIRLYTPQAPFLLDSVILNHKLTAVYPENGELLNAIIDGAWQEGRNYAQRIVPYWKSDKRRIYNSGKVLTLGDNFLKDKNIEEALNIWNGALNISTKMAIKASANIAWIYEDAGDFEGAADVLQEACRLAIENRINNADVVYVQNYLHIIQQRIEKRQLLDQEIAPGKD
ncbi:MAG: DUF6340 family protein [Odoribacter sp.]